MERHGRGENQSDDSDLVAISVVGELGGLSIFSIHHLNSWYKHDTWLRIGACLS
jgi:hypothetical protein